MRSRDGVSNPTCGMEHLLRSKPESISALRNARSRRKLLPRPANEPDRRQEHVRGGVDIRVRHRAGGFDFCRVQTQQPLGRYNSCVRPSGSKSDTNTCFTITIAFLPNTWTSR